MNILELIQFLRDSCQVDNPDITTTDSEYLAFTDSQLESIIKLCSYKARVDINNLDEGNLYLLILLSKKELYHRLAVKEAPLYNLEGETGKLARSDRFEHYYKLIALVEEEYENYKSELELNRDISNTDSYNGEHTQGEVFISSRYGSLRNYNHMTSPKVKLNLDRMVSPEVVELSWKLKSINRFLEYKLYICEEENVIDPYENNKISDKAVQVLHSYDIHRTKFRLKDLKEGTLYHVAILVYEQNKIMGYDEIQLVTKEWVD